MRKSFRLAAVVSVVVLALTTACSSTKPSQNVSSASASAQTRALAGTPEMALASHLKQIGAKLYGAHWCPYCHKQKALFGNEAFSQLDYVECDPAGKNARPELCQNARVEGFPTWEINGNKYGGMRSLQDLADLSGYQGERNFKN